MHLSNLNFSDFLLPLEVIFPQIEIVAASEAVLSLQYILLQEQG
jgi:precorrin-3B methylase